MIESILIETKRSLTESQRQRLEKEFNVTIHTVNRTVNRKETILTAHIEILEGEDLDNKLSRIMEQPNIKKASKSHKLYPC